ncbi:MAG: acyltransferase [Sphingopyxis sp.]|nr:acyltransferase [Sphingopyxis sp.]
MTTQTTRRTPIVGLDLARFLAAFLVMLFHLAYLSWAIPDSSAGAIAGGGFAFPALTDISWFGWVGVEIFFVLSGFVISYSAGTNAFAFFRSRVLRLLPGAWASATITVLILLVIGRDYAMNLGAVYLRTIAFVPIAPWLDGVYWTLAIEIAFYALVLALLIIGRIDRLETLLITIGTTSAAFWFSLTVLDLPLAARGSWGWRFAEIALLTDGVLFAIGGLLWLNLCRQPTARRWWLIAAFTTVGLAKIALHAAIEPAVLAAPWRIVVPMLLWLGALVLIVVAVRANGWLSRRLNPALVRTLGLATYPLYLLHTTVGAAVLLGLSGTGIAPLTALALAIATAVAAALATARYLEPPIRHLLDRSLAILPGTGARSPAAPAT